MKRGFTVTELLATIIIIGIIGTIGVVVFDNIVHNMRIKAFNAQKESIVLSAENWLKDKRGTDDFPIFDVTNDYKVNVTLSKLLNEELIEKDLCNQEERLKINYDNSYVEIKENGKTYEYKLVINNTKEACKWYIHQ